MKRATAIHNLAKAIVDQCIYERWDRIDLIEYVSGKRPALSTLSNAEIADRSTPEPSRGGPPRQPDPRPVRAAGRWNRQDHLPRYQSRRVGGKQSVIPACCVTG